MRQHFVCLMPFSMIEFPHLASFFTHEKKLYPLLDKENDYVNSFGTQRKLDFSTGRYCARNAMNALGVKQLAVLMDGRLPIWPEGIVGSISHSRALCGAVAARLDCYYSVGIDIEEVSRFSPSLWNSICTDAELAELQQMPPEFRQKRVALLFAMKEAFYKFQFPITTQYLGFKDVTVRVESERCIFSVSPEKQHPGLPLIELETNHKLVDGSIICLVFWRRNSPSEAMKITQ